MAERVGNPGQKPRDLVGILRDQQVLGWAEQALRTPRQ